MAGIFARIEGELQRTGVTEEAERFLRDLRKWRQDRTRGAFFSGSHPLSDVDPAIMNAVRRILDGKNSGVVISELEGSQRIGLLSLLTDPRFGIYRPDPSVVRGAFEWIVENESNPATRESAWHKWRISELEPAREKMRKGIEWEGNERLRSWMKVAVEEPSPWGPRSKISRNSENPMETPAWRKWVAGKGGPRPDFEAKIHEALYFVDAYPAHEATEAVRKARLLLESWKRRGEIPPTGEGRWANLDGIPELVRKVQAATKGVRGNEEPAKEFREEGGRFLRAVHGVRDLLIGRAHAWAKEDSSTRSTAGYVVRFNDSSWIRAFRKLNPGGIEHTRFLEDLRYTQAIPRSIRRETWLRDQGERGILFGATYLAAEATVVALLQLRPEILAAAWGDPAFWGSWAAFTVVAGGVDALLEPELGPGPIRRVLPLAAGTLAMQLLYQDFTLERSIAWVLALGSTGLAIEVAPKWVATLLGKERVKSWIGNLRGIQGRLKAIGGK